MLFVFILNYIRMGISVRIKELMERKGVSAYNVSNDTGVSQSTLSRVLNKDTKLNASNLKVLAEYFNVDQSWLITGDEEFSPKVKDNLFKENITGYYYPNVIAAAGMDKEMINDELKRLPINLPNWENGIDFINVYGDSMYPKYCSGEIIGIKEVEPQYLNFGYAYVIIFNDGQVFLKYIRKGKDDEHWLLASENPKYEEREYHLSLIRKVFIVKGVITKTTM